MQKVGVIVALLLLAGLMAVPSDALEVRASGFIDNKLDYTKNFSRERDVTDNKEDLFFARARLRTFINFIATDDLRGVVAVETDQVYGAPTRSISGRCIEGEGIFASQQCGFDVSNDNNAFELKHLYIDFRLPQLPIGNRFRIGGIPIQATPLHTNLLIGDDFGGGDIRLFFTDQVSLQLYFSQLEEDLERFAGSRKLGEDYFTGGTLMLKPLPGLDLHLLGYYAHLQQPFDPSMRGTIGQWQADQGATTNVTTEERYYVGFDARYRLGNLSIEPSYIHLLGTRKFCTPGSRLTTTNIGDTACTSVRADEIDFNAFQTQLVLRYRLGKWNLSLKGAWASGNKATDDINNQGIPGTRPADVNRFHALSVVAAHRFGEWIEILGRQESSVIGNDFFVTTPGTQGGFDRFGVILVAFRPEYKLTDQLILEGAVGAYWTDEPTACPASLRTGPGGACRGPSTPKHGRAFDFTGNSRFLGWEVDAGFLYTIMPGLRWQTRFGWAFLGDAYQIQNRNVQDAWIIANRLTYLF